jgi:hypothetical protein
VHTGKTVAVDTPPDLGPPAGVYETGAPPRRGPAFGMIGGGMSASSIAASDDAELPDTAGDPIRAARGILFGLAICVVAWGVLGFIGWLLL